MAKSTPRTTGVITVKAGPEFHAFMRELSERHRDMPLQTLMMVGVMAVAELDDDQFSELWQRFRDWRNNGFLPEIIKF